MRRMISLLTVSGAVALTLLGGRVLIAQEAGEAKYAEQVPDGLAFVEFRGYEGWQVVSVSQSNGLLKSIVAQSRDDRGLPEPAFPATASRSPTAPAAQR